MRLSQSHLSLLEACPRKFQYVYLDQVVAPLSPEEQSRREWGTQFHLMMQQRELGMPSLFYDVGQEQPQDGFQRAVDALIAELPEIFHVEQASYRYSEHRRTLEFSATNNQQYLLSAVYDLVFLGDHRAIIFDWKTYQKPNTQTWLAQHWQTRLYPFIWVETTSFEPNDVSMVYWFVKSRQGEAIAPESMTFSYDGMQHEKTRQTLMGLLDRLSLHVADYERGIQMPKIPEHTGLCGTCPFAIRCGRSPQKSGQSRVDVSTLINIEDISEFPLQNQQ